MNEQIKQSVGEHPLFPTGYKDDERGPTFRQALTALIAASIHGRTGTGFGSSEIADMAFAGANAVIARLDKERQ